MPTTISARRPFRFKRHVQPQDGRAIPILYIAHKGAPREEIVDAQTGKPSYRIGKDLTYFRLEYNENDEAMRDFIQRYGPEPNHIRCVLPFPDPSRNLMLVNECYRGGVMVHRCSPDPDNPIVLSALDPQTWRRVVVNSKSVETGEPVYCTGEPIYATKNNVYHCGPITRLNIIPRGTPRFGKAVVLSTSQIDGEMLTLQLETLLADIERDPRLRSNGLWGVPLVLHRGPRKVTWYNPEGKRVTTEPSLLWLEPDPQWGAAWAEHMIETSVLMLSGGALPEPVSDDPDLLGHAVGAAVAEAEQEAAEPEPGAAAHPLMLDTPRQDNGGAAAEQKDPAIGWPSSGQAFIDWCKHYGVTGKQVNSELHGGVEPFRERGEGDYAAAARVLWAALSLHD